MATQSSVLAWRIPGTGEPGGLLSMGFAQSWTRLKQLSSSTHSIVCFQYPNMSFQYPVAKDQLYVFFILIGSVGHLGHFILTAMEEMQEKQVEVYILLPALVENQHNVTSVHILLVKSSHTTTSSFNMCPHLYWNMLQNHLNVWMQGIVKHWE